MEGKDMPTRLRKVRKHRGSRSHGWGQSAGHRGAGSRGGHGKTGGRKHHWTYTVKYEPHRFGKHGFHHPRKKELTINVGELNQRVESLLSNNQAKKTREGIFIDLEAMGVDKLLGSGTVTRPLFVKVKAFTQTAATKIQTLKGQIIPTK
jgi:large subunit ribosomal protein L15